MQVKRNKKNHHFICQKNWWASVKRASKKPIGIGFVL
ncbi:hypothetical protein SAG0334_03025 [Streptococcus agalactiae GB00640]|nr:hypothetical protein SAG0334_03025 [Streptococcus agalactiae GB00640]